MFIYLSIKPTEYTNIVGPQTLHIGSKLRHIETSVFFCWLRSMFSPDHLKTNLKLFHFRSTVDCSFKNERSVIIGSILRGKYWWNYMKLTIISIIWSQGMYKCIKYFFRNLFILFVVQKLLILSYADMSRLMGDEGSWLPMLKG